MGLHDRMTEIWDKMKEGLLIFAVLLGFGFWINQGVELKGLYMDDLYLWSCYGEQTFREFVFPMGSTRFRFIFYLAAWLEIYLLKGNVELMVPFNIVLNALIAFSIYKISERMSGRRKIVSFLVAIAYLTSRFSYYQIGQFYGLMESLGLWAAIGMLYYTWRYATERNSMAMVGANVLYFFASFIHERYMVLVPVLILGVLVGPWKRMGGLAGFAKKTGRNCPGEDVDEAMNSGDAETEDGKKVVRTEVIAKDELKSSRHSRPAQSRSRGAAVGRTGSRGTGAGKSGSRMAAAGRFGGRGTGHAVRHNAEPASAAKAVRFDIPKWLLLILTVAVFVLIQNIRLQTIGTLSPAGTGGTDVEDTFVMEEAMENAWAQVDFVFGKNSGPDYLCLEPYEDSPEEIQELIGKANMILGISVAVFVVGCIVEAIKDWRNVFGHLKTLLLFLVFIALCIGASSVTIRVEMRWIYVVYAAALLLLAYMSSRMHVAAVLIPIYVLLMFQTETYYRGLWENLYYWPNQMRYNSLAEVTYGTYGDEIFDKQVYIIGNTYGLSDFTAETFLKVYDKEGDGKNTTIEFIDSDLDFKTIRDNAVILWEDAEHDAYLEVTEFVKHQRLNYAYGSYADGWVDEHGKIVLMNGNKDVLKLGCYYPGTINGSQICQIKVNGKRMPDLVFTDNYMIYEIPSAPYQMISLEFSCNFYVANAREKRGEERLAMVVTLGAE